MFVPRSHSRHVTRLGYTMALRPRVKEAEICPPAPKHPFPAPQVQTFFGYSTFSCPPGSVRRAARIGSQLGSYLEFLNERKAERKAGVGGGNKATSCCDGFQHIASS